MVTRSPTNTPSDDEEPLDPAVERIRARLSRLVLLGVGTLLLGLVAVFIAVIYRSQGGGSSAAPAQQAEVRLLPGAVVRSTAIAENGVLVTIDLPDGSVDLVVLDPLSGALRGRTTLRPAE